MSSIKTPEFHNPNCRCSLCRKITFLKSQNKYAWKQYFSAVNESITMNSTLLDNVRSLQQHNTQEHTIPKHIISEFLDMSEKLNKQLECPICMETITQNNYKVTPCGHFFCTNKAENETESCFEKAIQSTGKKCPICKVKLTFF